MKSDSEMTAVKFGGRIEELDVVRILDQIRLEYDVLVLVNFDVQQLTSHSFTLLGL